jgi:adenylate cyclase
MSLFAELKRRNVFRAATVYVAVAWLLIQVAETTFPAFGLDDAKLRILIVALMIGFIPAVALAWLFEITPEGVKRDRDLDPAGPLAARTNRLLDRAIVALLALGLTYFAVDKFFLSPAREQARVEEALELGRSAALEEQLGAKSIVVLPFTNMSPDPDQAYFADGIAEELLNLLARIPELRVISRTSAFAFKDKDVGIREIAEQLTVSHVLEGSVRRSGDRIRITAQLIEARSDTHLWSETYERTLDDVFAIQDEIAGHVVEALKLELLGEVPRSKRVDPQAYALFMQARQLLQDSWNNNSRVNDLARRALEIDPGYADVWTVIAWLNYRCAVDRRESADPFCQPLTPDEALRRHDAALDEALRLDPDNATAHAYRAFHHGMRSNDWQGAAEIYQRAVALDPTKTDVLRPVMIFANTIGRPDVAIRIGRYLQLQDPLCGVCTYQLMVSYQLARRLAEAEVLARDAIAAGAPLEHVLGKVLLLAGRPAEALEVFSRLPEDSRRIRLAGEAMALHSLGRRADSRAALDALLTDPAGAPGELRLAEIHAWIGEPEESVAWLRKTINAADPAALWSRYNFRTSQFLGEVLERPELQADLRALGLSRAQIDAIRFEIKLPGE